MVWPPALALALALLGAQAPAPEVLTAIRVQGNVAATDAEVQETAGIAIGAPVHAGVTLAAQTQYLTVIRSGRNLHVECPPIGQRKAPGRSVDRL